MTPRDKKIALFLIPLVVLGAYWFVVLGPKRKALARESAALQKAEQRRDQALAKENELESAKADFSGNYRAVLRLGKAIPSTLDMPKLILQLDAAARGTGIKFDKISATQDAGSSSSSSSSSSGSQPSSQAPASPAGNAAPGGAKAQTGLGKGTEAAGNTVNNANAKSGAADQAGADKGASGSSGSQPGGGSSGNGSSSQQVPGLQSVPLEFSFNGSFFHLANFFHRLKYFVQVAKGNLAVRGRLMTIDSLSFKSGESFPGLTADVKATVYLVPKSEGTTGGATSAGPPTQAASSSPRSTPAAPPTAAATP